MSSTHDQWTMRLIVWPHSTGNGKDTDNTAVAPNDRRFDFTATDFHEAVAVAKHIQTGVQSQTMVWQAPIVSLEHKGHR